MSDQSQKTEQPSQQRLRKARDEGRFPVSKEFTAAIQFATFAALLTGMASTWWPALQHGFQNMLRAGFQWNATLPGLLAILKAQEVPFGIALLAAGQVFGNNPIMHGAFDLRQAYPASQCPEVRFSGFAGAGPVDSCAIPGFFEIDPGSTHWSNYVSAAR